MSNKVIIGRETRVDFGDLAKGIPAKVDTGADGSAVWASDIRIDEKNRLCFKLFDRTSQYYTGEVIKRTDYKVARVKSASGDVVLKFQTHLSVTIKGKRIRVLFGLCDRSTHTYPVLIGRRTLHGRFIVDVTKDEGIFEQKLAKNSKKLTSKLAENPQDFYQNVYLKGVAE
ncbi:ATP-dependent zinc protease [Candidatus Saccharibacteria bacterium]|nr:ATP-dependent zinc protease [Candidatus Saccharibacteria bacterium]